jgi:hypothetical protein
MGKYGHRDKTAGDPGDENGSSETLIALEIQLALRNRLEEYYNTSNIFGM